MLVVGARSHREVAEPRIVLQLWCELQVEGCGCMVWERESLVHGLWGWRQEGQ